MRHPNWWLRVSLISIAGILSLASLSSAAVIVSEYVEGSGNNKAIELYNPTDTAVEAFIHEVQGAGETSPMVGARVIIEGIVTADFQGPDALGGFFVQEEDADMDADPATSEGIFVFDADFGVDVQVGDRVAVQGTVAEYYDLTELTAVTGVEVLAGGEPLPTWTELELPLPDPDAEPLYLEAVEGMRVTFVQPLTVSETYNLGRYGEILLSGGRLMTPTNVADPGAAALAVKAENTLNQLLLDDAGSQQNPDPIVFPDPELSADNTLRCGYTVTGLTGVMAYAYDTYRIYPTRTPIFEPAANPRTDTPEEVGGRLKVASFNVLNYFNGDGLGGGFPTSRGADTAVEFSRQRDKIVSAILAMEADVIGLMEIENDGYGDTSAIVDLVKALNAAAPQGYRYGVVDPGLSRLGTDEIAVGLIYNTLRVEQAGTAATLGTGAFADRE